MKRVALWLVAEVGEGGEFTKEELRKAFPGVSQADRRMRDLRSYEWRIDTNREDPTLESHQQRLVKVGLPVWEGGVTRSKAADAISDKRRREVIVADGYMCRSCGITPGDTYAGTDKAAQLDIARREVRGEGGMVEVELVTECNRCRVGGREIEVDLGTLLRDTADLAPIERRVLAGWLAEDRREFSAIERLWSEYRSLPAESRAVLRDKLGLGG